MITTDFRLPLPNLPNYSVCRSIAREPVKKENNKDNRIRNFPHEPGNWASYVYIPVVINDEVLDFLEEIIKQSPVELSLVEDFHISVTRTFVLRHHWIRDFTSTISESVVHIKPFFINLLGFKVYLNENKTRTFIGIRVREGSTELTEIVKLLDNCLADYKLPPFYKPASFHMSVLWCAGDKSSDLNKLVRILSDFSFRNKVSLLKCNSGNKSYTFNFLN